MVQSADFRERYHCAVLNGIAAEADTARPRPSVLLVVQNGELVPEGDDLESHIRAWSDQRRCAVEDGEEDTGACRGRVPRLLRKLRHFRADEVCDRDRRVIMIKHAGS